MDWRQSARKRGQELGHGWEKLPTKGKPDIEQENNEK